MSHFLCLVFGGNVDEQLAPYHEFECTGVNDQYVQETDITDEVKKTMSESPEYAKVEDALDYHGLGGDHIIPYKHTDPEAYKSALDFDGAHKFGYALVWSGLDENKLIRAVKRTNPQAKWDWYQVGGRWSGFLKAKLGGTYRRGEPGIMGTKVSDAAGHGDVVLKSSIDVEGMRNAAEEEAAKDWDAICAVVGTDVKWKAWNDFLAELKKLAPDVPPGAVDKAREEYWAQPPLVALRENKDLAHQVGLLYDFDNWLVGRDVYLQQARDRALCPYAFVHHGQWHARGEMGWFGLSDDKTSKDAWAREFNMYFDNLPPDMLVTVVDCHI